MVASDICIRVIISPSMNEDIIIVMFFGFSFSLMFDIIFGSFWSRYLFMNMAPIIIVIRAIRLLRISKFNEFGYMFKWLRVM